ncbi:MAG: iron ABC transporter permease [Actinomyces succiniciruminis]|nr:iron ABC transporter permease [Actinomyces succiniciruminis]
MTAHSALARPRPDPLPDTAPDSSPGSAEARSSRRGRSRRPLVACGLLLALLALAVVCSIAFGARVVGIGEILDGLAGRGEALGALAVAERVPRTATAVTAGAALGVSGALMQAVTRNPIADPGILGINTGASLAIVAAIAFVHISSLWEYLWVALAGAALTAVFVYAVGSLGPGGTTPVKLALAGVATSAALSSLISAIMLPRAEGLTDFRFWQVGSLGRGTWGSLATVAPFLLVAVLLAAAVARPLNSLALGEEMAVGLGVRVGRTRLLAAAAGVIACATTTALAGPIGFVGLMVPHAVRMLVGPDNRWLLPLSALGGAALLTFADVLGRVIARPSEVSVGVVTAFVGAPVLIAIARGAKVREL